MYITNYHREVIRTEEGEYLTIPDGDPATVEEICKFLRGNNEYIFG
jgi:hypothetical protein